MDTLLKHVNTNYFVAQFQRIFEILANVGGHLKPSSTKSCQRILDMNMIKMSLYPIVDTATADRLLAMNAIHFVATIS